METTASLLSPLPIEPLFLGLSSTLFRDGLQASGGGEMSARCGGNERRVDLMRAVVYFLHFHKEFQGWGRKVELLYNAAFGNSLWVGELHTPHALKAPDGLMHNLCIMQGTLWGPVSGKFVRGDVWSDFHCPGYYQIDWFISINTLTYWSTTSCDPHNCQWAYFNASLFHLSSVLPLLFLHCSWEYPHKSKVSQFNEYASGCWSVIWDNSPANWIWDVILTRRAFAIKSEIAFNEVVLICRLI